MRRTAWRLLKLAASLGWWMALAALFGFATVGSSVGLMTASAFIISSAALHPSIADLQVAIVGVRFFGIARGVFRYLERYVSHHVTFRLLARLRVWFYRALEPLAPARLMQYRSGDLLSRVVADIETLENFYVRVIAPPVVAALIALATGAFLYGHAPRLAYVLLPFLALAGIGVSLFVGALGRRPGERMVVARAELAAQLVDGIQGVADLVAFGQGDRQVEQVRALGYELTGLQRRMAWIEGLHDALGGLLMHLATWAVLAAAIPLVSEGRLAGVYLGVVALAAMSSFEAVTPLPSALQYLGANLEAARRLFEVVDAEPVVQDSRAQSPHPQDHSLSVESLRFRYGPDEPLALDGVSFTLPQGGRLAIVGPSGAGKSTLANLLLRFWEYDEGRIRLGGYDLREYRQDDVRGLIGVVTQSTYLFNATIRDNLLIARPDAGQAEVIRAAQQAQIHDFIQALPEGYDTWVGEQGLRLSGGERQRLAIARAILKDAPILILDEPTANLDAVTEREVMSALFALMEGRTTLLITHRLVGLEAVDEILVLRAGRVVERGRHHDLLCREGGLYRRMWDLQRQGLSEDEVIDSHTPPP